MGTAAIIAISLSSLAGVLVVGGFAWTARNDRSATRRERASRQRRAPGGAGSEPGAPSPAAAGDESADDDTGEVRNDP
jgi:hypothetical protein